MLVGRLEFVVEQRSLAGLSEAYFAGRLGYSSSVDEADEAFRDLYFGEVAKLLLRTFVFGFALSVVATLAYVPTFGLLVFIASSWIYSGYLWLFMLFCIYVGVWFIPRHEFAGRWQLMLEEAGDLVETSAMLIVGRIREKQVPVNASVVSRHHRGDNQPRFYVLVDHGRYQGYVSVLGFGTDLFVTWSMWRHHRPASAIWRSASDALRALTGNQSVLPKHSRNDPQRALREAIHDAVRFGIEQAMAGHRQSVAGTFGSDIDIEDNAYCFAVEPGFATTGSTVGKVGQGSSGASTGLYDANYGYSAGFESGKAHGVHREPDARYGYNDNRGNELAANPPPPPPPDAYRYDDDQL